MAERRARNPEVQGSNPGSGSDFSLEILQINSMSQKKNFCLGWNPGRKSKRIKGSILTSPGTQMWMMLQWFTALHRKQGICSTDLSLS